MKLERKGKPIRRLMTMRLGWGEQIDTLTVALNNTSQTVEVISTTIKMRCHDVLPIDIYIMDPPTATRSETDYKPRHLSRDGQ